MTTSDSENFSDRVFVAAENGIKDVRRCAGEIWVPLVAEVVERSGAKYGVSVNETVASLILILDLAVVREVFAVAVIDRKGVLGLNVVAL